MDFDLKLAYQNVELFKRDFAKGLRVEDLQGLGAGTNQEVFKYENLVVKQTTNDDNENQWEIMQKYNDLLVEFSNKGIEQQLKFAPILGYVKNDKGFCTVSPFIDGTELPDCTVEQMRGLGVEGLEKYISNNLQLKRICLGAEFHDTRNFKLSPQGNINVIDYSTYFIPSWIYAGMSLVKYAESANSPKEIKYETRKSCMIIRACFDDKEILENLSKATENLICQK